MKTQHTSQKTSYSKPASFHAKTSTNASNYSEQSSILASQTLPGKLAQQHLTDLGTLQCLDEHTVYVTKESDTIWGRSMIVAHSVPRDTIACALTAAWVWVGGDFPNTFDIISQSHFRTKLFSRRIRVFHKTIPTHHYSTVGGLYITNPIRTVC
ncbi:MAG: hypothetical protein Q3961_04330, partial [Bifidobacteriaceae bacterium]|nr:hypothetical protein [Bifidobacteriaceae bacterium]